MIYVCHDGIMEARPASVTVTVSMPYHKLDVDSFDAYNASNRLPISGAFTASGNYAGHWYKMGAVELGVAWTPRAERDCAEELMR